MALESKYFGLDIEPEKRGQGAWDRNAALKLSASSGPVDLFSSCNSAGRSGKRGSKKKTSTCWITDCSTRYLGWNFGRCCRRADHTEWTFAGSDKYRENFPQLPISILEEPVLDGFGMDLDDPILGLFGGMIFYTWGFTDKKVIPLQNPLTVREKSLLM